MVQRIMIRTEDMVQKHIMLGKGVQAYAKRIVRLYTMGAKRQAIKNAAILGNYPGGGELSRSIVMTITDKQGTVRTLASKNIQTQLLEGGPGAVPGFVNKPVYLSNHNEKMRSWAQDRLGKHKGKITVGGPKSSWGKPSRRFLSNAKRAMDARLIGIEKRQLNKLGGK
jgi:hypothetical protein